MKQLPKIFFVTFCSSLLFLHMPAWAAATSSKTVKTSTTVRSSTPTRSFAASKALNVKGYSVKKAIETGKWVETLPLSSDAIKITDTPFPIETKLNCNNTDDVVNVFLVYWGDDPFPYGIENDKTIEYSDTTAVKMRNIFSSEIKMLKGTKKSLTLTKSTVLGLIKKSNPDILSDASKISDSVMLTLKKSSLITINNAAQIKTVADTISSIMSLYYKTEFVENLEDKFCQATGGKIKLNSTKLHVIAQPDYDYDSSAFLNIKPFSTDACDYYSGDPYDTCVDNMNSSYREFPLDDASKVPFYYYEMMGGRDNKASMFDELLSDAEAAGWDSDTQILGSIVNVKYEALGVFFYSKDIATVVNPYQQMYSTKEVPYITEWHSQYYLIDEMIHEIGHGLGLGHDCTLDDADATQLADEDCLYPDSIMNHWRDRPEGDNRTVNKFSSCDINFLKNEYLATVTDGGPRGSAIEDFSCY